jgi:hypothetical protein
LGDEEGCLTLIGVVCDDEQEAGDALLVEDGIDWPAK